MKRRRRMLRWRPLAIASLPTLGSVDVIPGRQRRQVYAACVNLAACGEPGIHNHSRWLWIPGSLAEPVIGPRFARTRWLGPRNDDRWTASNRQSHNTCAATTGNARRQEK